MYFQKRKLSRMLTVMHEFVRRRATWVPDVQTSGVFANHSMTFRGIVLSVIILILLILLKNDVYFNTYSRKRRVNPSYAKVHHMIYLKILHF